MAFMERQATSLLMADSERVWVLDKVGWGVGLEGSGAPSYETGNLDDSIKGLRTLSILTGERSAGFKTLPMPILNVSRAMFLRLLTRRRRLVA